MSWQQCEWERGKEQGQGQCLAEGAVREGEGEGQGAWPA